MNRRSFIRGVLAAMVSPAVLAPRLADRARWKVRRRGGLYTAEYRYICLVPADRNTSEMVLLDRNEPLELNPEWIPIGNGVLLSTPYRETDYAGKWRFEEWHGPPSEVLAGSV